MALSYNSTCNKDLSDMLQGLHNDIDMGHGNFLNSIHGIVITKAYIPPGVKCCGRIGGTQRNGFGIGVISDIFLNQ